MIFANGAVVLGGVAIVGLIVAGLVLVAWASDWFIDRRRARHDRSLPAPVRAWEKPDKEMYRTGQEMALLLARGLQDPLLTTSPEWDDKANELVSKWFDTKELT